MISPDVQDQAQESDALNQANDGEKSATFRLFVCGGDVVPFQIVIIHAQVLGTREKIVVFGFVAHRGCTGERMNGDNSRGLMILRTFAQDKGKRKVSVCCLAIDVNDR